LFFLLSTAALSAFDRRQQVRVSPLGAIAFGLLLSRYPRWGAPVIGFFALLLTTGAIRFSQQLWAG